ncbi:MAG: transcriptional repressor [Planctomycetes bacterium]|nr:transcriptional repressor [Planctomycetota bacterium]
MSEIKKEINLDNKLSEFECICRNNSLKVTPQRIAVYKALISMDTHPTAEQVYQMVRDEISNISLDTVNRTLHTLSGIGAAFIVEGTGQPRRFDGGLEDHQHFLCIKCGEVIDFHHEPFDNIDIPDKLKGRFKVLRKTVYLEGLCGMCSHIENNSSKRNPSN